MANLVGFPIFWNPWILKDFIELSWLKANTEYIILCFFGTLWLLNFYNTQCYLNNVQPGWVLYPIFEIFQIFFTDFFFSEFSSQNFFTEFFSPAFFHNPTHCFHHAHLIQRQPCNQSNWKRNKKTSFTNPWLCLRSIWWCN